MKIILQPAKKIEFQTWECYQDKIVKYLPFDKIGSILLFLEALWKEENNIIYDFTVNMISLCIYFQYKCYSIIS